MPDQFDKFINVRLNARVSDCIGDVIKVPYGRIATRCRNKLLRLNQPCRRRRRSPQIPRRISPHPSRILPEDRGQDSTAVRIFRGQFTNAAQGAFAAPDDFRGAHGPVMSFPDAQDRRLGAPSENALPKTPPEGPSMGGTCTEARTARTCLAMNSNIRAWACSCLYFISPSYTAARSGLSTAARDASE